MVTLKLVELSKDMVIYEYYPEDNKKYPGKIALNLKTKERIFLEDSSEDFGKRYAAHALRRIEEYNLDGEFKKEGLVAWY